MRRMGPVGLAVVLVVALTAACGSSKKAAAPTTTAPVAGANGAGAGSATEVSVQAPAQISGGLVDLTLTNTGKEHHQAIAIKLAPGKTLADYGKYFSEPNPS